MKTWMAVATVVVALNIFIVNNVRACGTGQYCSSPQDISYIDRCDYYSGYSYCVQHTTSVYMVCAASTCSTNHYIGKCIGTYDKYGRLTKCTLDPNQDFNTHDCCANLTLASCQGTCGGGAGCSVGTCTGGTCVNVNCPSDPDCICDSVPPTPSCSVSIGNDDDPEVKAGRVVSGTVHDYKVTITGDGSPKTLALSAPSLTPKLMIV